MNLYWPLWFIVKSKDTIYSKHLKGCSRENLCETRFDLRKKKKKTKIQKPPFWAPTFAFPCRSSSDDPARVQLWKGFKNIPAVVVADLYSKLFIQSNFTNGALSLFFQAEYNGLYCYNGMTSAHETFTRGLGSLPINKNGKKIFFSKMFDISLKFHYDEPAPPKTWHGLIMNLKKMETYWILGLSEWKLKVAAAANLKW